MRKILLLIVLFLGGNSYSQENRKLWGGIEIGYGISLSDTGDLSNVNFGSNNNMFISSLKAILGYYVMPELSLGLGIGLNSYTKPGLNTLPMWLDVRYHPFFNKEFQINGDLGYTIATSESNRDGKFLADFSVGYALFKIKKAHIVPAIGYNFCNYSVKGTKKMNQSRHSLFLKVGVIF